MTEELMVELHEKLTALYPYADQIDLEIDGDWAHATIHLTRDRRISHDLSWHGPIFGWLIA